MSTSRCFTNIIKFIITTPVIRLFQIYSFISLTPSNLFCTCQTFYNAESRIVGGTNASIQNYPYQISLRVDEEHICGGSILSKRYILTAAHCVDDLDADECSIRAGSTYHKEGGMHIKVEEIFVHPKYNTKTADFDAAILYLAKPLKFSKKIGKIKLPDYHYEYRAGIKAVVTGWGDTKKVPIANRLQSVTVPIMDQEDCINYFKKRNEHITKRMFCAGYHEGKMDACGGDSGGPLVVKGYQLGIVSWGINCAMRELPGVYTNVALIRKFIRDTTGI